MAPNRKGYVLNGFFEESNVLLLLRSLFVTNGSFIDGNAMDGFRKCLTDDFSSIYCFNLRGNQRTQGELSKKEGGKIFGSGSRACIAITLLIKNPEINGSCNLFYHDIGDYLTREQKFKIISEFESVKTIPWTKITPNSNHDWINQRDPAFEKFILLSGNEPHVFFSEFTTGVLSSRDSWVYNFSDTTLSKNMKKMIEFYNDQTMHYKIKCSSYKGNGKPDLETFINTDSKNISWSRSLKNDLMRLQFHEFSRKLMVNNLYRPFCKQWIYFDKNFNEYLSKTPKLFPEGRDENLVICLTGKGSTKSFSALITNTLPDYEMISKGQLFPLYTYEKAEESNNQSLPGFGTTQGGYIKHENVTEVIQTDFKRIYNPNVTKEDVFYYVYGILHSPEFKNRFPSDLAKQIPRLPFVKDFWAFSKAGRALAKWHLNYETVDLYPLKESKDEFELNSKEFFKVRKMTFGKRDGQVDKTTIIYNSHIALKGIPLEAYDYVVNGRPALEWIMERYQIATDPDSHITNDPNEWSDDPKYILKLVKRIVTVSLETMKIVNSLPPLNEKK